MDPLRLVSDGPGFFTRAHAKECGYADREITRLVRRGTWMRIRRGAYVFPDVWQALDPVGRHSVRSAAVLHALGPAVALSHVSGMIAHGIDVWGVPLDQVHVTRLDGGQGRVEGDVVHHRGFCTSDDVRSLVGVGLVLQPERCVLETTCRLRPEVIACLLDAGLRSGAFSREELTTRFELMERWPGMHHTAEEIRYSDGRAESVGESRGRWLFRQLGLPLPELQFEVRRADGSLAGTSDWAWHGHGLLGEFDGKVKYGRLLRPGQTPGEVVFAEKRREDELRELTSYGMIRLIWDDYSHPRRTGERLERALRRAG